VVSLRRLGEGARHRLDGLHRLPRRHLLAERGHDVTLGVQEGSSDAAIADLGCRRLKLELRDPCAGPDTASLASVAMPRSTDRRSRSRQPSLGYRCWCGDEVTNDPHRILEYLNWLEKHKEVA